MTKIKLLIQRLMYSIYCTVYVWKICWVSLELAGGGRAVGALQLIQWIYIYRLNIEYTYRFTICKYNLCLLPAHHTLTHVQYTANATLTSPNPPPHLLTIHQLHAAIVKIETDVTMEQASNLHRLELIKVKIRYDPTITCCLCLRVSVIATF
jgi:hypothetical protein